MNFEKILSRIKWKKSNNSIKIYLLIIFLLFVFLVFSIFQYIKLNDALNIIKKEEEKIYVYNNSFNENISLNNYDNTRYKIINDWKTIINNIRDVHKSPVLISTEYQDKELCAWYIWALSEKIWWKRVGYSIWMQNQKNER